MRLEYVLILAIDPGWGGQRFLDGTARRLDRARELIERSGRPIVLGVDGGRDARQRRRRRSASARTSSSAAAPIFDGGDAAANLALMQAEPGGRSAGMSVVASTFVDRASVLRGRERARLRDAYGDADRAGTCGSRRPRCSCSTCRPRNATSSAWPRASPSARARIRPHIKVHKSPDLSRLQVEAGAIGLSVATVWEAVVMAASGIDDLFVVNTVAGPLKLRTLAELARDRRVLVAIDQAESAEALGAAATAAGSEIGVLIEVDTGMDRAGVDTPEDAAALAQVVDRIAGLRLEGVTGYEGHCSMEDDLSVRTTLQRKAMGTLVGARDAVLAADLPCPIVSAGGTRTWWLTAATPGVTEVQAGTYVVMDAFHEGLEGDFEHALHVGTTVISRPPGRLIVDVGSKTVASPALSRLVGVDAPVMRLDEEHGIFVSSDPAAAGRDVPSHDPGLRTLDRGVVRCLPRRRGRPHRGHLAGHPPRTGAWRVGAPARRSRRLEQLARRAQDDLEHVHPGRLLQDVADRPRDVIGLERRHPGQRTLGRGLVHVDERRLDDAGLDDRDADAAVGHLHPKGVGERHGGVLARDVGRLTDVRDAPRDRRDDDDVAMPLLEHDREARPGRRRGPRGRSSR